MLHPSIYIHPQALVESTDIGENTRIWAFAHVMKGAQIGADCNICGHSFIESGAKIGNRVKIKNGVNVWDRITIEEDVFVGPGVVFTNHKNPRAFIPSHRSQWADTLIKKGATLAAGSILLPNLQVGEYAFIAAGAVVTKNVPAHALMKGNPARLVNWTCACLKTRVEKDSHQLHCSHCGTQISPKEHY